MNLVGSSLFRAEYGIRIRLRLATINAPRTEYEIFLAVV
jgi:hypothetical protein